MERKIYFSENWLIFLRIWGEAELILRIWGAKEKYFQGAVSVIWGDQCIIFRDQGSTNPPGSLNSFHTFPSGTVRSIRVVQVLSVYFDTLPLFHTGDESPESPRIDFLFIGGGGGGGRVREVSFKKILQS